MAPLRRWTKKILQGGKLFGMRGDPSASARILSPGLCALCSYLWLCVSLFASVKGYKGYKDGLQPESLADGNWLVKQKQPVSKIETKSDTNLRSLFES